MIDSLEMAAAIRRNFQTATVSSCTKNQAALYWKITKNKLKKQKNKIVYNLKPSVGNIYISVENPYFLFSSLIFDIIAMVI